MTTPVPNPPSAPSTLEDPAPVAVAPLVAALTAARGSAFRLLHDVEVEITVEIGRRRMRIADVLKLDAGQTLELAKAAGEPLDILVNGRLLGRGEAVVLGDRYAVRISEIVSDDKAVGA